MKSNMGYSGGNVVQNQSEHVVLNKESVGGRLQNELLCKRLRWILIRLELTQNVDEDAPVKGRLAVNGRDDVGNLLKGQRGNLLHDLGRTLHLLAFKGHQRLLSVVKVNELRPSLRVVKQSVVLLDKGFAYCLVSRIHQSHCVTKMSLKMSRLNSFFFVFSTRGHSWMTVAIR